MTFSNQKLSDIAISVPGAIKLFREYDLDYCCGGSVELASAAQAKNLDINEINTRLTELQNTPSEIDEPNWTETPFNELITYIITRFHDGHREQLPELLELAKKVEEVHADREDCPIGVAAELENIFADLSQHLMKEEQILFPMINAGNYMMATMPIRVMEMEHDEMGDQLEVLKSLTNNVTAPADACTSWRTLYSGIAHFIDELMLHTHTENNILFPRVRKAADVE
ncbi:iron-sulfur cluster repair protein YtfE [Pasteurella bettyae]|uniref:Iron-sulfur cluster repair di-iron protein n=1 Tax=Pasteurella bettyae CCUG 2042 TaxID=1095749 RepID=I3DEN4_9PAST|nr:iron-sulfur cluster repair protein YtfE [Pasteurella bettyae]EIJ70177.1 iron-sulfur cluster repair di-iron protein [Pasteurella bettyae CCUG 2042]SUB21947.1 Regulator of cell morphogenesis and NO signaling [Pasteurella bettyae]